MILNHRSEDQLTQQEAVAHDRRELRLVEIVTTPGDHLDRWRQLFEILDGVLRRREAKNDPQMCVVREMLTRRAV